MATFESVAREIYPLRLFKNPDGTFRFEIERSPLEKKAKKRARRIRARTLRDVRLKAHRFLEAIREGDFDMAEIPKATIHLAVKCVKEAEAADCKFEDVFNLGMAQIRQLKKTAPISQLVEEFLKSREERGRSPAHLSTLNWQYNKFLDWIGHDTKSVSVATEQIDNFIQSRTCSRITKRNYWKALFMLFKFGIRAKGYLSINPVEGVDQIEYYPNDPELFTPAEVEKILDACVEADAQLAKEGSPFRITPWAAIKAFAGPRNSEMRRLNAHRADLVKIKRTQATIRLSPVMVKGYRKKAPRLLAITPNLRAWLAAFPPTHPWPHDAHKWVSCAAKSNGVFKWKKNGLRKTWESCAMALADNPAVVYKQSGHSIHVSEGHYDGLISKREARKLFKIMPPKAIRLVKSAA